MPIITLTTDWKQNDYYTGAVKGRILSLMPEVQIVDISHQIASFNISEAAFILKSCYRFYPEGTIHIIGVNSEATEEHPHVVCKIRGQYFIGADNGILSLIASEMPEEIVKIEKFKSEDINFCFPELDVFAPAACHLAKGGELSELGTKQDDFFRQILIRATYDEASINGKVIYIDSYNNTITNISVDLFNRVAQGRSYVIYVQSHHYKIEEISKSYQDVPVGEMLALFNARNLLEIAVNRGSAADLFNLSTSSSIRIKFFDKS